MSSRSSRPPATCQPATQSKCKKCATKYGKDDCPQKSCYSCCTSPSCSPHLAQREQNERDGLVLAGESEVNKKAEYYRTEAMDKGRYCYYDEEAFRYRGETVMVWCKAEFLGKRFAKELGRKFKGGRREERGLAGGRNVLSKGGGERVRRERMGRKMVEMFGVAGVRREVAKVVAAVGVPVQAAALGGGSGEGGGEEVVKKKRGRPKKKR